MRLSRLCLIIAAALPACAPIHNVPSLAPRAAEQIDPRLSLPSEVEVLPPAAEVRARVAALIAQARAGDGDFAPLMAAAERVAGNSGARESESWIAAQQALSAAIEARKATASALGDIDALAATAIHSRGTITPGDLAAVQEAARTIAAIDAGQAERVAAVQRRLGT